TIHQKLLGSRRLTSVEVMTEVWETADGKGIDDLGKNGRQPRTRVLQRRPAVTARRPTQTAEPGRVPPGRPLAEVQTETQEVIREFVRQWDTKRGRVQLVAGPPGIGKSTVAYEEIERSGLRARIVVSTTAEADEIASRHPTILRVEGRSAENC